MPGSSSILPIPERNKFYCREGNTKHSYTILDHDKNPIYSVTSKTVATRSHYRVVREEDKVAVGSIDQGQMASTYTISDEMKNVLAEIKIPASDEIKLVINKKNYHGKVTNRSKLFEFYDDDDKLVMTIDKKLVSLSDKYKSSFVEDFPAKIAAFLPVILDDFFHSGTAI